MNDKLNALQRIVTQSSKYNHIMIDIEALGTSRDCVIVSVGAVRFDLDTGKIHSSKYWDLGMGEQQRRGRTIDSSTIMWWANQTKETQQALRNTERSTIINFIGEFNKFIEGKVFYWAKGTNYDLEIISDLYRLYEQRPPFRYSKWVDARVYYLLGKKLGILPLEKNEGAHNALQDAEYQTRVVCQIHETLQRSVAGFKGVGKR